MAANEDADGHTEAASDLEKKIIKQIEFYFGDKNLPRDRFLMEKADEDDGWITLDCLTTFNRLKSLSTDTDAIAKALRKSDTGLIEVSEDNTKVRRAKSKPLPEDTLEARQDAKAKTVYCKGFPTESSLDQLEEFFADKGKVTYIVMRRTREDRTFKGSVFVEFESADQAKAFVNQESLKYNDQELIKMMKYDYYKQKEEGRKDKKKGDDVKKEQKDEKQEDEKQENEEDGNDEEHVSLKYDNGCVLHFKNVGEQTSREDLKSLFGEHENIAWVDFTRGGTEGFVRFSKGGGAQRVIDALKAKTDGKVLIREVETTLRVLEGEEEKDYWKKAKEEMEKARQKKAKKFRGGQRGRFGGGRGRGNRKGWDRSERKKGDDDETLKRTHTRFDEEEPTAKKVKTEDD